MPTRAASARCVRGRPSAMAVRISRSRSWERSMGHRSKCEHSGPSRVKKERSAAGPETPQLLDNIKGFGHQPSFHRGPVSVADTHRVAGPDESREPAVEDALG